MKKRIVIIFIIFVVAFTFLGSNLFFNVSAGDLFIGYPQLLIKNIVNSPDGNPYNLRKIGNELLADLSTIFVLGGARTIGLIADDSNNWIRLQDCESTLDKAIYMVQSSIRYSQGTYPDPYYDTGKTLYNYVSLFIYPLPDNLSVNNQYLNIYNLPYNFLNVYFNTPNWRNTYGYTIHKGTHAFEIEVFDGDPSNTISNGLYKSIPYDSFARGDWNRLSIYYPVAEFDTNHNTYFEFICPNTIPSITYAINGELIHLNNSSDVQYNPYGEIDSYFLAF